MKEEDDECGQILRECGGDAGNMVTTVLGGVISWLGVTGARVGCYRQGDGIECVENAGVGVMLCPH
jgi:hypothetical protein